MSIWPTAPGTTRTSLHHVQLSDQLRPPQSSNLKLPLPLDELLWLLSVRSGRLPQPSWSTARRGLLKRSCRSALLSSPSSRQPLPLWLPSRLAHFFLSPSRAAFPSRSSAAAAAAGERETCLTLLPSLSPPRSHSADYWSISSHSSLCSPPLPSPSLSGRKISWLADMGLLCSREHASPLPPSLPDSFEVCRLRGGGYGGSGEAVLPV